LISLKPPLRVTSHIGAETEMRPMSRYETSPFSDPLAVDAWDSWFRWRDGSRLHDVSIEATWLRVARALAAVEASAASRWVQRFVDAQASWQLLFDEKILASAGTQREEWPESPVAVLNLARFVCAPFTPFAKFDFTTFGKIAELAVRGLDNALSLRSPHGRTYCEMRVGIIGLADALMMLEKDYATVDARITAGAIARVLAEGCLRSSIALAQERGACATTAQLVDASLARHWPDDLLAELRHGLRHRTLTAIAPQHRLALLANNVADALDPISATRTRSPGYALALANRCATEEAVRSTAARIHQAATKESQLAMRSAVQPWIDAPIDYPAQGNGNNGNNGRSLKLPQAPASVPHSDGAV
jgi:ribonucleoside-diphosphate reductase alpha chain